MDCLHNYCSVNKTAIDKIVKKHDKCSTNKSRQTIQLMISHLCEILVYLTRSTERAVTPKLDGYSMIMQDAVEYINKSYASEITLDSIAKKCSLSRSFFSKKFKEVTGFGFSEYLTLVRIKSAERLLAEGKKNVTDIAFECGFNDSSYFASKFKELIGITPKKYQKEN